MTNKMDSFETILEGDLYIAGPCSIESKEQLFRIAKEVKESGANVLRGGAFKPRTDPDSFQGLGKEGIEYLLEAREKFNMPVITELVDYNHLDMFEDIDIIQIGARNMQNFELLKAVAKLDKYVLLKRNMGATVDELIAASNYLRANGNNKIILCERGIRTFEPSTRYTFDVNSIAVLKDKTDLRVVADPSHATGISKYVQSAALAGIAAGSDGLIIEVHDDPNIALTDKNQAILPEELKTIIDKAKKIKDIIK